MSKREHYNTKKKDIKNNGIKKQKHEFTVKDIYDELKDQVGLTTIYRMIDKLITENILNRYISKDNTTYYQYLKECEEDNHFYLKCDNCGELVHIDCDCIEELSNHIINKHGFKPNKKNIIINGTCERCIRAGGLK